MITRRPHAEAVEEFLKLDRRPLRWSRKLAFYPVLLKLFVKCWPTSKAMDWSRDSMPSFRAPGSSCASGPPSASRTTRKPAVDLAFVPIRPNLTTFICMWANRDEFCLGVHTNRSREPTLVQYGVLP